MLSKLFISLRFFRQTQVHLEEEKSEECKERRLRSLVSVLVLYFFFLQNKCQEISCPDEVDDETRDEKKRRSIMNSKRPTSKEDEQQEEDGASSCVPLVKLRDRIHDNLRGVAFINHDFPDSGLKIFEGFSQANLILPFFSVLFFK